MYKRSINALLIWVATIAGGADISLSKRMLGDVDTMPQVEADKA